MRILIVHNHYRQRGGEDAVVACESELLRNRGHAVELFEKTNEGVRGLRYALNSIWSRTTTSEIKRVIARFNPQVAHIHNVFHAISPAVYGAIGAQGIPIVQTLHNFRLFCIRGTFERDAGVCERCAGHSHLPGVMLKCYRESLPASVLLAANLQMHRFLRTFENNVSQFVALNDFCMEKFVECGIARDRITVKPNFVDIQDPGEGRARAGGLYVGRMSAEKGVRVLAKALTLAPSAFTAIGDGVEVSALRVVNCVELVGFAEWNHVMERMRGAEYLVMPSIWYETFGLVIIEAFACRLPVIASNIGAMAELVEDGKTGLLFEAGSAEDLAAKIKWAQQHPDEMRRMGNAARVRYERSFTSAKNYEMLMSLYESAIAQHGARRKRMA